MKHIFIYIVFIIALASCKKFVEIQPPSTQLVGASVYSSNATASAAVTGILETIVRNSIAGNTNGIGALAGLSADEFKLYATSNDLFSRSYKNDLLSTLDIPLWAQYYNCIYQSNLAIEGVSSSSGITPSMKQQLIGETKFLRAFCYFYLINIYGDVPLITISDYKSNSIVSRSHKSVIYDQIVADLKDCQSLLTDNYLSPDGITTTARVRPNQSTATALLARVYLYQEKWDSAELQSTAVINNPSYQLSADLNKVFLAANNEEAIWQLEGPNNGFNAPDGAYLAGYKSSVGPSSVNPFLLSDSLLNSFENGDLRKTNWIVSKKVSSNTYYFPYKYKLVFTRGLPPAEYEVMFRLAEQYLIRAEARAKQNDLANAIADLDIIRNRAGLPLIANTNPGINQSDLLTAILHERQVELFTEFGHRWFDLRRTNNLDLLMSVITPNKGGTWQSTDQLYPIGSSEIKADPNITQNPGYN
jgi:hypothetical protein